MVAAAPLGDVVQQHGDVEHAARCDLLVEDRGRERMIVLELAALDRGEQADGADRMLVDRIMMVHVELHLRDDAAEVGNEAAEYAGLVHPAKHQLRVVDAGQHFHEQGIGARVVADLAVDQRGVAARRTHRRRVDLQPLARGEREQLEQAHRVVAEEIVRRGSRCGRGRGRSRQAAWAAGGSSEARSGSPSCRAARRAARGTRRSGHRPSSR